MVKVEKTVDEVVQNGTLRFRVWFASSCGEGSRLHSRHHTRRAALRAARAAQRGLEERNPGTRLACGFRAEEYAGGEWEPIEEEAS